MTFSTLKRIIYKESNNKNRSFEESSDFIQKKIFNLSKKQTIPLLKNIGIIPESIVHDSSEEKLFAKVADILLAKAFQELGLSAVVNKERANCADVIAKSKVHSYTFVGDAKAFRLSRTAKNQKDFKVKSMVDWKGDNNYSVLVCPFYQYPKTKSQIYGQALNGNVCLFSWEHLVLFLENNVEESKKVNLSKIWNISDTLSEEIYIKDKDKNTNFHERGNKLIQKFSKIEKSKFDDTFKNCRIEIIKRGNSEIKFWKKEIEKIKKYTHEKAIKELIKSMKLNEKIIVIKRYIELLKKGK